MYNNFEEEIGALKERNKRVELDKAWEVSWTRRFFVIILTYIIASLWLFVINENHIFVKAMVPVLGYILSTFSIPQLKRVWIKNCK